MTEISNSLAADRLAVRLRQDGYLYLRQAVSADRVLAVREAYFRLFPSGYLKDGTSPRDGIFSGNIHADFPNLRHTKSPGKSICSQPDVPELREDGDVFQDRTVPS